MALRVEHELHGRRRGRNIGLGLLLAGFVGLVFGLTVVKVVALGEANKFIAPGGAVNSQTVAQPDPTPEAGQ